MTRTKNVPGQKQPSPTPIPYTVFTRNQKRRLRLLLGFATITSPLTATCYFPLLPLLRTHFATSAQAINLTLTIYIVFQALSPAVFGPLSDSVGRRSVFLITLALYAMGNLGLALNRSSYAVLLVLRALQSVGASAALAVSYGVVADVCVPSERGRMLGPVSMALNLGACVGPVIGGSVAWTSGSYEWVFWSLVIVGVVLWLGVGLFLPETARVLVGNGGSDAERRWWEESWSSVLMRWLFAQKGNTKTENQEARDRGDGPVSSRKSTWQQCRFVNPLACLRVMFHLDTFFHAVDARVFLCSPLAAVVDRIKHIVVDGVHAIPIIPSPPLAHSGRSSSDRSWYKLCCECYCRSFSSL